jgi:ABC-type branched-subunit amino acid transport system ATPase component
MLIVGGRGNTFGALVGAGLLVALPEAFRVINVLRQLIYGLMLAGVAVFRPQGIVGSWGAARARSPAAASGNPILDAPRAPDTPNAPGPIVTVENLTVRFGGLVALESVTFEVRPGEIYGVIGPNGAGKTTLFNAISGVVPPERGTIRFDGRNLAGVPPYRRTRRGIARTFQNIRLFASMDVWETVEVGCHARLQRGPLAHLAGTPGARAEAAQVRARANALLALVGLQSEADARARSLPYGHQRRLEIARALATGPRLLLLDEPAAGMNARECDELIALIRTIRDQGITVLLVEHHMRVVMAVCDRILVLNFGRTIAEGTPAAIRGDPKVIAAYLGTELEPARRA